MIIAWIIAETAGIGGMSFSDFSRGAPFHVAAVDLFDCVVRS